MADYTLGPQGYLSAQIAVTNTAATIALEPGKCYDLTNSGASNIYFTTDGTDCTLSATSKAGGGILPAAGVNLVNAVLHLSGVSTLTVQCASGQTGTLTITTAGAAGKG